MRKLGINITLLIGQTNQRWLSGFNTLLYASRLRTFVTVVDAGGKVTLVVPIDIHGTPHACADELRRYGETMSARAVLEVISEKAGSGDLCIGIDLGRGSRLEMCQNEFEDIRNGLGGAEIVDIAPVMWKIRGVKSKAEVEKMSRACTITDRTFEEVFSKLEPGISEHALAQMLFNRICELGGESAYLDIHAGPDREKWANHPNRANRLLCSEDLICVDGGCILDGYFCDIQRMVSFVRPADDFIRYAEAVESANQAAVDSLEPGITGAEIYSAAAREMEHLGYEGVMNNQGIGHGVGLDIHEVPEMGPESNEEVGERAVISIEPWSIHPEIGLYNLEDNFAVDADGAHRLTSLPRGLYCVEKQCWLGC